MLTTTVQREVAFYIRKESGGNIFTWVSWSNLFKKGKDDPVYVMKNIFFIYHILLLKILTLKKWWYTIKYIKNTMLYSNTN